MKPTSKELAQAWNTATDEEAARWSERLNFLHTEYSADCSGCDSGDPLDCVEVELLQVLHNLQSEAALYKGNYAQLQAENEKLTKLLGEYRILADSVVMQKYHIELLDIGSAADPVGENRINWFDRRDELRSEL